MKTTIPILLLAIFSYGRPVITGMVWLGLLTTGALAAEPGARPSARNLIINEVTRKNRECAVVYEIPDEDGKAAAVQSIGRVRDQFWRGRGLIDAGKTDEGTLREGLKKGFVLYTILGGESRLLKAATQPLGLQIEGDTLRWKGVTAPVRELQVIAVGKNPYGEGNCIVYAAGTSTLLGRINANFHGPCSYHIFQGKALLKEGFYRGDFSEDVPSVSRADAQADIEQFFSTLQRVHPDLLAKVTVEKYLQLKQQTREEVFAKADPKGQIPVEDLAYALYYAAAFFQDGHTSLQWHSPRADEGNTRFPGFLLSYDDGAFVVAAATKREMAGMELLAVNGKPAGDFLRPILDRCSGETAVFKAARFTRDQLFWYGFSRLCGSARSLTVKLRDAEGKESEQPLETLSALEFRKLTPAVAGGKHPPEQRSGTRVEFLDADRIAHFIYPSFTLSEPEKKKVDAVFEEIKARKSRDLIVDLRGNGGGNSMMGDYIFSYLYAQKFCSFSKMRVKLSRDLMDLPDFNRQAAEGCTDLEGMVVTMVQGTETQGPKRGAFFSGRAFLLVDGGTFSSAADFATMFRDYRVGTILGSESGGLPVCFGDVFPFTLEHSGISCGVSFKQFFGPKPKPGDDEHGVLPDLPAAGKQLRAYQGEADPVLAFTVNHIQQTREER